MYKIDMTDGYLNPFSFGVVDGEHRDVLGRSMMIWEELCVKSVVALQGERQGGVGVHAGTARLDLKVIWKMIWQR